MEKNRKIYNVSHPDRRRNDFDMLKFALECEGICISDSEILKIPNINDGNNKTVFIGGLNFELIHQ